LTKPLLLAAVGNTLRSDDGAGHALADLLEPLLQAASVPTQRADAHQWLPELAEEVAAAGMVVFLDAAKGGSDIEWRAVAPAQTLGASPHSLSPDGILWLAEQLYGCVPPAFLLTIPGNDFSHGENLSATVQAKIAHAAQMWTKIAAEYSKLIGRH
jgi:hydrogenase maturation protease